MSRGELTVAVVAGHTVSALGDILSIETTIVPDKKGGFGTLPVPLIVLCGGLPKTIVSDLESSRPPPALTAAV